MSFNWAGSRKCAGRPWTPWHTLSGPYVTCPARRRRTGDLCWHWQPRLPDPSYAGPAPEVVIEDKSGAALAWVLCFSPS
jgi:hypothetical protein